MNKEMPRLALIGYGKMGRMIEGLAPEYGCEVVARLDEHNNASGEGLKDRTLLGGADVAIEFSTPEAAVPNLEKLIALRVPVVVGTTGWLSQMDRIRALVETNSAALVWSANFSVGVQVFLRAVHETSRWMSLQAEYGAWGWEIHHDTKKDAPSGTLLRIADEMRRAGYTRDVNLSSNRAGRHPGTHEIGFDSAADTITLRHTARSREGFARGALQAACWIPGKCGFFEFGEVLFGGKEGGA